MGKIYNIPLDKGYAYSDSEAAGAALPPGFWSGKNMMYRPDGALTPRYSYKKLSEDNVGPSTNILKGLCQTNYGLIAITTDGKPYYYDLGGDAWNASSWNDSGSAPTIMEPGRWAWLNGKPVFSNCDQYPLIFTGSGTSFKYIDGGVKAVYPVEHQNRLLLAALDDNLVRVHYSDVGDPHSGYSSNYVDVGDEMEYIRGVNRLGDSLLILKDRSIWAKMSIYSELTSSNFKPVYVGVSPLGGKTGRAIVARNTLYFTDSAGIMSFSSGIVKNLSAPFTYEWLKRDSNPSFLPNIIMTYWYTRDWLIVSCGSDCDTTWAYDVNSARWMRFSGIKPTCFASIPNPNRDLNFARYNASGDPYVYTFGFEADGTVEESSFEQVLQTPYLDLDNPFSEKYLRRIFVNAQTLTSLDVYLKTLPDTYPDNPSYTFEIQNPDVIHCSPSIPFREISLKLTGNGRMVVKSIAVEYQERRP